MASSETLSPAFRVHAADNMAVVLAEVPDGGGVELRGDGDVYTLNALTLIPNGHKIALCDLAPGEEVLRYGRCIGLATRLIRSGEWVHLHNCRSRLDERSGSLDAHTGAPTDTSYD
ncbi:MAG: UxaA family hydrolase [Verrucomicrobia bacterium]|nr:UxaA family hydrolase [Verrucomicrobiota bacterium]MCH8511177.1 UxaA family hydrolase [Kiritimatiellia bacterium]